MSQANSSTSSKCLLCLWNKMEQMEQVFHFTVIVSNVVRNNKNVVYAEAKK